MFKSSGAASVTFSSSLFDNYKEDKDSERVKSEQVKSLAQGRPILRSTLVVLCLNHIGLKK